MRLKDTLLLSEREIDISMMKEIVQGFFLDYGDKKYQKPR